MKPNVFVYNAAITTIAKAAKRLNKGRESTTDGKLYGEIDRLLQEMEQDKIEPDGFTYTSAISCCGSEGLWEQAMLLLNKMQQGGPNTQPNKIAYTAAIASCASANQADNALQLFQQMKEQGLSPDIVAYNALFAALRAGRRSEEAYQLWNEMMGRKKQTETKPIVMTVNKLQPDIITLTE
jgi:pentatricopeptide repeat protein